MKVELIAEIGQAHDGSLGIAHSYIDSLANTGIDTIKWQVHIAEAESSIYEPFRIPFAVEDASRYEYWERTSFTLDQWQGLKNHCEEKGLRFLASPFSITAVEWLEKLNVERYKVGSGEIGNLLLLQRLCNIGKPVLLSTGLASEDDLNTAVALFATNNIPLTLLQCTTAYPTPPEQWALNGINLLKKKYGLSTGYSDHSGHVASAIAAVALGAEVIEFHATYDKQMFGPDAKASLTIKEIQKLASEIRVLETALNANMNSMAAKAPALQVMFGKSLALRSKKHIGDTITFDDLESKKPANQGIPASKWQEVVGKKLVRNMQQWEFIQYADIQ